MDTLYDVKVLNRLWNSKKSAMESLNHETGSSTQSGKRVLASLDTQDLRAHGYLYTLSKLWSEGMVCHCLLSLDHSMIR